MSEDREVDKVSAAIERLTGRRPISRNLRYLTNRLADLRAEDDAGHDVRRKAGMGSQIMSLSMPKVASETLERILRTERIGASELIRRALASWAKENGYEDDAAAFTIGDS